MERTPDYLNRPIWKKGRIDPLEEIAKFVTYWTPLYAEISLEGPKPSDRLLEIGKLCRIRKNKRGEVWEYGILPNCKFDEIRIITSRYMEWTVCFFEGRTLKATGVTS